MANNKYTGHHLMRWQCMAPLPKILHHRPMEHWEVRPDLVARLKQFVDDMELWCYTHCDCNFVVAIDQISGTCMPIQFELEMDAHEFARSHECKGDVTYIQQPEYSVSWTN